MKPKLELKFGWLADSPHEKGFTTRKALEELEVKLVVSHSQILRISGFAADIIVSTIG